ncbi:MAG: septum formation protein Maf [Synergistaceae bacterium]|nr:Maf family protein [Synergistota bacterium]NLM72009.1 septum formation protein Maf [Synergistaceae bacterium]
MVGPLDLVLASASPRRRELLSSLGWRFRTDAADVCEELLDGELPRDAVVRLARAKAGDAVRRNPGSVVIAADTLVSLDGNVLGKPSGRDESFRMISLLSGRTHSVFTGIAVRRGGEERFAVEETRVVFRHLSPEAAMAYVDSGEGDDKAGAYAIQGRGALLVSSIEGDYFNVVGLPLRGLSGLLEEFGCSLAEQWRNAR